jgi:hypothetical protein
MASKLLDVFLPLAGLTRKNDITSGNHRLSPCRLPTYNLGTTAGVRKLGFRQAYAEPVLSG